MEAERQAPSALELACSPSVSPACQEPSFPCAYADETHHRWFQNIEPGEILLAVAPGL